MNADPGDEGDELDDEEGRDLGEEGEETAESVTVEITGLSLYTHHGVTEAEREVGQRLVLDLRLDLGETDATVTDSIEDTVDYAEVCQLVALIAQQRSHRTLERLCSTIADRLLASPSPRSRSAWTRSRSRCGAKRKARVALLTATKEASRMRRSDSDSLERAGERP
jgi:dihydroneopterin aldolase